MTPNLSPFISDISLGEHRSLYNASLVKSDCRLHKLVSCYSFIVFSGTVFSQEPALWLGWVK